LKGRISVKKWVFIIIGTIVTLIAFPILDKEFSNIKSIEVEYRGFDTNKFEKQKLIKDNNSIKLFTHFLNRANQEKKVNYGMDRLADYKVTVNYEDGSEDILMIWKQSGEYTFITRDPQNDAFKIKKRDRKEFLEILLGSVN
jgi:hypothetical protein